MPSRSRPADRLEVAAAVAANPRTPEQQKMLTKHFMALLEEKAPGHSVEVRVPPYAAAQVIEGVRHTRGTPPAVIEMDVDTWLDLATGALSWNYAFLSGRIRASGERADLTEYLPLMQD